MTLSTTIWVGPAAFASSVALVWLARWYALRRGVIDVPNHRSSHVVPTPRGGGVGIVVPVILIALLVLPEVLGRVHSWAAAAAILSAASIGWLDDLRSLSLRHRLVVHLLAGGLVSWLAVSLGVGLAPLALWPGLVVAWWVFWTVSAINVVNFMDGIDAIIALQSVVFGLFAMTAMGASGGAVALPIALIASTLGFLLFNWPPARIFLGDAGSGGLGVIFVLLGIVLMHVTGMTVVHAFLPLSPLFLDEIITMQRRISRHESLLVAHRSHVYQLLVQSGWSHGRVSLLYAGLAIIPAAVALLMRQATGGFFTAALAILLLESLWLLRLRSRAEAVQSSQNRLADVARAPSHPPSSISP